ncbi:MAG TPA: hypothetical protein DEQ80_08300 [Anaerolinea thermolimosa]|uniref:Transglycosylase SLT domain-containing protein n=1 Tax=Anaerolinea thermolimosa TaxID=229919 RepID=A0A3D1JHY6_9CHLR|nr:hypothetical protein [Anaerolinea thermolimosa]
MYSVQKAIFPGILLGMIVLIGLTRMIGSAQIVLASTEEAPVLQAEAIPLSIDDPAPPETPADAKPSSSESADGECAVSSTYPQAVLRWCSLITRYAVEANLDPNLVAAVILQESGGNPEAYSRSGAVGLMQVMPRDGIAAGFQCINGPCFASRPGMAELLDPEFNIAYGTRMLAGLIQKRGSVRDGLFAYGPMNVGYSYADKILAIYESHR